MALLDLVLRLVSRLRYVAGGQAAQKPVRTGPGYPVW